MRRVCHGLGTDVMDGLGCFDRTIHRRGNGPSATMAVTQARERRRAAGCPGSREITRCSGACHIGTSLGHTGRRAYRATRASLTIPAFFNDILNVLSHLIDNAALTSNLFPQSQHINRATINFQHVLKPADTHKSKQFYF